jgi:hypothetical protein
MLQRGRTKKGMWIKAVEVEVEVSCEELEVDREVDEVGSYVCILEAQPAHRE